MLNYLFPVVLFLTFSVFGQNHFSKEQLNKLKEQYKNYDFIYLTKNSELIPFKSDDYASGFGLKLNQYEEVLVLSSSGCDYFTKQSIEYSRSVKLIDAKSSLKSNSNKNAKATLSYEMNTISSTYVFYDGEKSKDLSFEKVSVGDIIKTSYSLIYKDGRIPLRFFFAEHNPIISSKLILHEPEWIQFEKQTYNDSGLILEQKEQKGKSSISVFTYTGPPYIPVSEEKSPGFLSLVPHIIFQMKEYTLDEKHIGLPDLTSLQTLYTHYLSSVISDTTYQDVRVKTLEITKGLDTDLEKIKAIYYWIQNNIQYVAFEEGISGFQPRLCSNTLIKKYGDCKDMAVLIYGMSKSIGIEVDISWIGTRDIPYTYTQTHNQYVDNHMIATFTDQSKRYFLDATSDSQPFDLPTSFIQGKEALIFDPKTKTFVVERVPIIPASTNFFRDSTVLILDDKVIMGTKRTEINGYNKVNYSHSFREFDLSDKNAKRYSGYFFNTENTSREIDFRKVKLADRDSVSEIELTFHEKAAQLDSNTILLTVFTGRLPLKPTFLKNRKLPLELDNTMLFDYLTKVEVPSDYSFSRIPEDKQVNDKGVSYLITHELINNVLIQRVTIELDQLIYSKEEVAPLYRILTELTNQLNKPIILKKK